MPSDLIKTHVEVQKVKSLLYELRAETLPPDAKRKILLAMDSIKVAERLISKIRKPDFWKPQNKDWVV